MSGIGDIITFWALSALAVSAAMLVMAARTLIHAVLFLILFFITFGLFLFRIGRWWFLRLTFNRRLSCFLDNVLQCPLIRFLSR